MKAKRILIVEDDKMLSTIYKMFLNDLGHELIGIYSNANEAIHKCENELPDVILMDILLPGETDGITAANIIQEKYDVPIIFVSSITDEKTIQRAVCTKSYGFLVKPIDKTELGILIELAYSKHKFDKEIKIKEYRYRKLIEDSHNAVLLITNNQIEYINISGLKLFGTIHIENMLDKPIAQYIEDENATAFTNSLEDAIVKDNKIYFENIKFKTIANDYFWAKISGSVINYKNQKTIQLVVKDVTEELKTKNISSEQDNIIDNIYDGILTINLAGKIKHLNKGAEKIFETSKENVIGRNLNEVFKLSDSVFVNEKILEPVLEKGFLELKLDFNGKNGFKKVIQHTFSTLKNENKQVIGIVCYSKDLTENLLIEKKLKESEEKIEMLSLTSNDAYWDWEIKTNKVYFSPKFKEMLGYEEHELENNILEWESRLEQNDRNRVSEIIEEHLQGKIPFYSIDYQIKHKDGSYRWFTERGLAMKNELGKPYRIVGTFSDVTTYKQTQGIVNTNNANLQAIFDSNKEAIIFIDSHYKVIDFNKKAIEYAKKIIQKNISKGQKIFELLDFISESESKELFQNTIKAGVSHNLERSFETDLGTVFFELTIYPVNEGDNYSANRFCLSLFDITTQKNIEYELIETKAELKPLFESSIQRFYLCDLNYNLVAFNKAAKEIIREEFNRLIKKGDNILDYVPKEVGSNNFKDKFEAAKKGEHIVFKEKTSHKSGAKWLETHVEPISNEKGEIIRVLIWTLDITKEKMAEKALLDSQKKYYSLFSEASDAILMINDDLDILVDCNESATKIFGYTKDEFRNLKLIQLSPEIQSSGKVSLELRNQRIDSVKKGNRNHTFQWIYKRKNGETFDAEVSLSVVKIGDTNFRYAIIRDITERKNIENKLQLSEQRNRSLIQAIPDLIFVIDKNGNYRDFFSDNQKIYDVSDESIIGKNLTDFFTGAKLEEFKACISMATNSGKLQMIEYQLNSSIGLRWFEARLTALNNDEVFCLVRDINERKQN
ncbi:MAG TPA: hypothetical protein DDX39_00620 [Bacteroidales bacterium]|nr:MAG: hypothetical protein A2W98_08170 [Bacteroidetes bacterium GWF2_33_38]OFY73461.1 MAG: hypothetical protein A2265_05375 [Bacteroidetes bacterium RIFOXYA12_FULL_33_9]OFY87910.1 MAG: hypothetical protein A2236_06950 [Bacteroidetes bacterium RIFOXYA2_FULL_33_7]HBF87114.1 hypothetical protein [Bacteroidales bacterium]